jgi:predicted SnoaL-like aldol condensation-catalyzing enzyme
MKLSVFVVAGLLFAGTAMAQTMEIPKYVDGVVTSVDNPEALFTSPDPKLHKNKQAAYNIIKVLIEAGHWERANEFLTERYLQHNPRAKSGRDTVVKFFTETLKMKPRPIPEKMQTKVVSVVAEGDYVIVTFPRHYQDPKDPTKTFYTTWFDMWRFVDGKADEHWDSEMMADLKNAPAK